MAQGQAYPNLISWARETALPFGTETSREMWNQKQYFNAILGNKQKEQSVQKQSTPAMKQKATVWK